MCSVEDSPTARALVISPTYNELQSMREIVDRFPDLGSGIDLLVVDDASPDGTGAFVREIAAKRSGIYLIERRSKQGLGSAYITGFRWALEQGYSAIVEMDADLSHDPAVIPQLLERLADVDLAIGSRYVQGGRTEGWGRFRRALSRAANIYARVWLGFDVSDSTSGLRAYRAEALRAQDLTAVRSEGYAFQIEMTRRVHNAAGSIAEIPITFANRVSGRSKLSRRIVLEALVRVAGWGLADRVGRASRRLRSQRS
jgi:glycosyltransferase involved in cell wall biosynthesis